MATPNVSFVRPELRQILPAYELIRDCVGGEVEVKRKRQKYLPMPNTGEDGARQNARYQAYLTRAIFYNVARHTLGGMVGSVFQRRPVVKVPDIMKPICEDVTGVGVSVDQLAKKALGDTVGVGRCGLFVDYPATDKPATMADVASGKIRPWLTYYQAEQIVNWRTEKVGGVYRLSLVVLKEKYAARDDGFEVTHAFRYRVLRLVNGQYTQTMYSDRGTITVGANTPVDSRGEPFDTIPFMFIGPENNDPDIDPAPLYDLCSLNIGHYRNSADYEESSFLVGQPTPYITGVTRDWVQNVWPDKKLVLGSRSAIILPVGGAAGLIQAGGNTMPENGMKMKEAQMVAIGAKLVQNRSIIRTATEANQDEETGKSVLSSCADNVGYAFTWALAWCAAFMGQSESGIEYSLNSDFDLVKLTSQERTQLIAEFQAEAITFAELRQNLRRAGIAVEKDEDAIAAIAKFKTDNPDWKAVANPAVNPNKQPNPAEI